ncbi:uncharacterized protein TNCV_2924891 [Trichonephila clavipes]|nr:uncharacterized protein TNCV_2924891 [Trichonephila clavipes]
MLDSVGRAIGVRVQTCQVFSAHVQQLRIFELRDPHLSQVESHKQDSSDIPIKSNRSAINQEIGLARELVHYTQSITPQTWRSDRRDDVNVREVIFELKKCLNIMHQRYTLYSGIKSFHVEKWESCRSHMNSVEGDLFQAFRSGDLDYR